MAAEGHGLVDIGGGRSAVGGPGIGGDEPPGANGPSASGSREIATG
jgi:hypothetical protein